MREEDYHIMWVTLNKPTLDKAFLLTNNTTLLNALKKSPPELFDYTNLTHFYCAQYLNKQLKDFSVTEPDIAWKNALRNFRRDILPQVQERIESLNTAESAIFEQINRDFHEVKKTASHNLDAAYQSYLSQHPELQIQNLPELSAEEKKKEELVQKLTGYITRTKAISSQSKMNSVPDSDLNNLLDFGKGSQFFKEKQAADRHLNLLLAEKLLGDLTVEDATIEEVFHDIKEKRSTLMEENNLSSKIYIDAGIRSIDLKNIIQDAEEFVAQCSATNNFKL